MTSDEQRDACIKAMDDIGQRIARANEIATQEDGCIDWIEVMTAAFDALLKAEEQAP